MSQLPIDHLARRADDRAWTVALRAGDLVAFERMYTAYFVPLWTFATRSVAPAIAEEIVQDIFFDLWRRRDTLSTDAPLGPYLFAAVRSKVIQHQRHARVVESTAEEHADHPLATGTAPALPDEHATLAELQHAIAQALAHLSEAQRTVLTLRWSQGMTYEQIAGVLGISVDAAKKQGARAQKVVVPLLAPFAEDVG